MAVRRVETTVDGRPVRYLEAGSGPPVLIVHGLGLSSAVFRGQCRVLAAAGFRAVVPDLPGFGRTQGPRFGQTVAATAAWLLDFAEAVGLGAAAWIGHSLAAQATMQVAALAPHRVRALILATPTGAPGRTRLAHQFLAFVRDIEREPLSLVPLVARQYLRGSLLAFLGTWIKAAWDHPLEQAPRIQCPTLIVTGRDDPIIPADFVALLLDRIPRARAERLPNKGHGVILLRSEEFGRIVVSFLRETIGPS